MQIPLFVEFPDTGGSLRMYVCMWMRNDATNKLNDDIITYIKQATRGKSTNMCECLTKRTEIVDEILLKTKIENFKFGATKKQNTFTMVHVSTC